MTDPLHPSRHALDLPGQMLQRGFWLYVWRADHPDGVFHYVGRTGDNPAPNAASPYNRLGQHLGANKNASALKNHLDRRLGTGAHKKVRHFRFVCYGPILPEVITKREFDALPEDQRTLKKDEHVRRRDIVGALERKLAEALSESGYSVLNTVHSGNQHDSEIWLKVKEAFIVDFPNLNCVSP